MLTGGPLLCRPGCEGSLTESTTGAVASTYRADVDAATTGPVAEPGARSATSGTRVHARDLVKPRLRGVLHQWAALAAVVSGVVLVAVSPPGRARAGCLVYAVVLVLLFGISALYHRVTWSPRAREYMKRLDHSTIFVFIAGTYTPFCLALLHGTRLAVFLSLVWAGALAGIATRMVFLHAPRWLTVPLYVSLGWAAVFVSGDILHGAGVAALVLLYAGGLLYTLGALAYACRRPDPVPAVFGYHEVFHSATVVGAACHYVAVLVAVLSTA